VKLRVKTGELPNIVHPLTQEVLLMLEHYSRVREIVDRCSFPDYQVLRTLHTLAERNMIALGRAEVRGLPANRVGEELFDDSQLRRIRDNLQGAAPRGEKPIVGKVLIVASDPTTLPDLLRLLRAVPSVTLNDDFYRGIEPKMGLGPLGKIELEGDMEIELLQIPRDDSYRALWPMASHGALATLVLLTAPVSESSKQVSDISEVLKETPLSKVLHVVLLGRKERIAPDELRENLELIDESSLFLIPLESGKEPTSLLRSLFARVVP
jgi:hypothetical protein